jgi:hypothetical protein
MDANKERKFNKFLLFLFFYVIVIGLIMLVYFLVMCLYTKFDSKKIFYENFMKIFFFKFHFFHFFRDDGF